MLHLDIDPLSEEPISARGGRYEVYRGRANGALFHTVTEDGIPVSDHPTLQGAEQEAARLEREAENVRHGQAARGEEVLA